ncbi:putative hydrolase C777.06c isoform X2 [Musa acuminata AAA Group]|uniref:putative hydrolase C777.06c isoform X2 n=1 Tax=Musa acuminata AAA Group TaxID=214697 RepID=UPI0031D3EFD2
MGVVFRVRAVDLRRSTDEVDLFPFAVEKDGWFHRIIPIYIFMKGAERMGSPSGLEDGNLGEGGEGTSGVGLSSLIFLGTGCSNTVPNARCLIQPSDPPCAVCTQSLYVHPEKNPNYRCNTSLLIDYCQDDGVHRYIIIDVGKTFREQVLRWFTHHKIPQVDSIILTHEHADAIFGLDDVRIVQSFIPFSPPNDIDPTPIYATKFTMDSIAIKFPYLMNKMWKEGQEVTPIAQLDWKVIESDPDITFMASGLEFVPLPVLHGEDYVSLGFLFGQQSRVAYISDVSRFPDSTENLISKSGGQLDLLIIDTNSLHKVSSRSTHLCFSESLDAVKRICPKQALLIGMTHDYDHHKLNVLLAEWTMRLSTIFT